MRKLAIVFALLLPLLAGAQRFELGVNGSVNYTFPPALVVDPDYGAYSDGEGRRGYGFAISGAKNFLPKNVAQRSVRSFWQLGMKVDVQQLRASGFMINYLQYLNNFGPHIMPQRLNISLAEPAIAPSLFLNRKMVFEKNQVYVGVSAGAVFTRNKPGASYDAISLPSNGKGFTAGIQLGFSRDITPRLGLTVECSPRYYNVHYSKNQAGNSNRVKQWSAVTTPVSLGLRYNLRR